jgi:serine/threonine-protein kinase ATR
MVPLDIIIPLQTSLNATLPVTNAAYAAHVAFPEILPTILGFEDEIELMHSLQRPRKLKILGSDGKLYFFLCKPEDDLRKDSRLMQLNSIVNRLFKKDPESRKRGLNIRTYAVVPLNEKSGLIEWVPNMCGYRSIVLKLYKSLNKYTSHVKIKEIIDNAGPNNLLETFTKKLLPLHPPVFYRWFLESFSEPSKWLTNRSKYCVSTAVMSMLGFIVGLGDRHGENILFDEQTGECLHVDLNCLFEKGMEFEKPEKVPFRLTHNMLDAFGISGVDGAFKIACCTSLDVLRKNKDLLMSVLETFLHDPLCEWSKKSKHLHNDAEVQKQKALKVLASIDRKLDGFCFSSNISLSVQGQVLELINEATDPNNLCQMYIGWASYL